MVVASVFLILLAVPFGPDAWFADLDVGIYFALAVSSISVSLVIDEVRRFLPK